MKISHPLKWLGTASFLLTVFALAFFFHSQMPQIIAWVNKLGWLAPLLFLLLYCMATLLFLPTMVLTLAGGALFGPLLGTVLNLFGASLGAACSFLVSRHLISEWFSQKKGVRLGQLINKVEQKGWVYIALLRLLPIIPFNLVNYALGVTRIKFRTYLVTTLIFLIPPEIIYTYLGYTGMDALLQQETLYDSGLVFGLIFIILALFKVGLISGKFGPAKHLLSTSPGDYPLQKTPHPKK